jgi:hypothetical protein
MSAECWQSFRAAVRTALGGDLWVDATYGGAWQGVDEEAAVFLADLADVSHLRDDLAALADEYGQDAIGLVVGDPELVGAP